MEQLIDLIPLDVPTAGGSFYATELIEAAMMEFNERAGEHGVLGEFGPPVVNMNEEPEARYLKIDIANASHIVKNMWIDGGYLRCKVHLLSKYAEIANLMNLDFRGIPRATGVMDEQGVCTKYTLITVDLASPE